jgi:NTP pyrophosphatase (non-canonical NTP hydrolase)
LLGVVEEVGELSHAHLKLEQGIRINEDHKTKQVDAVGDIVVFLAHYCTLQGIDFGLAVKTCWNEVKQRDWKAFPKNGVSE